MNSKSLDDVDGAYQEYVDLLPDLDRWTKSIKSEEDTRLKIIDPIFSKVLGWDLSNISTEEPTGDGFIDYKLSINDSARLVVEAKKDSKDLGIGSRTAGRAYKLDGPILSHKPLPREGILQAIGYCGAKNSELACVTNGREWIIFRGSRLGDGKDTLSGSAIIFPTLAAIRDNFKQFYDLLGCPRVENFIYRAIFQEAEGQPIRARVFSKTLRPVESYRLLEKPPHSQDMDRVMSSFFRRISGDEDPEMLAECFVVTKESEIADDRLSRIADDLSSRIRNIDTAHAKGLSEVIKRVQETNRNEFVLIVGTKGAGKSTFIDRFFRYVITPSLREDCIVIRTDVGKNSGDVSSIINWLNNKLLSKLESELFGGDGATFDELQGMFYDEYKRRLKGPYKHLYESDKTEFKKQFGAHVEEIRGEDPQRYIERLVRHVVLVRRKVPCLIFDNTDHFSIEFQEAVFRYARSIYQGEICLVIIPVTDKTSWQLSQQGALQSFDNEAFFLPTPHPKTVIEKRIRFLEERLSDGKKEKGTGYFIGKGIQLSLDDLKGFAASLQHIFMETGNVSLWIGSLANSDVRRCLELSRDIVSSPYIRIDSLVKAFISGDSTRLSEGDIKKAIIRRGYDIYPTGVNKFVQNIFALNTEIESTPLLALRLLRLLRDAKHHDAGGLEDYVTIDQILDYIQAIGIERRATMLCLDALLKSGLCLSYDPTIRDIEYSRKLHLSPSGLQHLFWGSFDDTYISSMLDVTPISNESVFKELNGYKGKLNNITWRKRLIAFIDYLLAEDAVYTQHIHHAAYVGQGKLRRSLEARISIQKSTLRKLENQ